MGVELARFFAQVCEHYNVPVDLRTKFTDDDLRGYETDETEEEEATGGGARREHALLGHEPQHVGAVEEVRARGPPPPPPGR